MERTAVPVLSGLYGVAIPVASAVLTAIDPGRYTIIDYRALQALGQERAWHTVDSYLARRPAHENQVEWFGVIRPNRLFLEALNKTFL